MCRIFVIVASLAFCACGPRKPGLPKEQALPELRKYILETPAVFGRVIYNPQTVPDLDANIEKAIEQRNFGRMPADAAEAKRLAFSFAPGIWGKYLDTPEGRAAIEARIREHWENPTIRIDELNGVVTDLGLCPGTLTRNSKGSFELRDCPAFEHGELTAAEIARRLQDFRARYPNAKAYNFSVTFTNYRLPKEVHYRWEPVSDLLFVTIEGTTYRSKTRIGGFDNLLSGESPSRTQHMQVMHSNLRVGVPR